MNDFTKEELEWMAVTINYYADEIAPEIVEKLRIMIDNYCDHTPSETYYEQFRWNICDKCGAQYK